MSKRKVTILRGLPASGKSTRAKEMVASSKGMLKRVNKDDLRAMIDGGEHSKGRENFILTARDAIISAAISNNLDVVVDDTNLSPVHEERIRALVGKSAQIVIDDSFLSVPLSECIARDARRPNSIGKAAIKKMARNFKVGAVEPYYIEGLPSCVICDLDGTLALMGDRNPYDASSCEEDGLNHPVADYVRYLAPKHSLFFFSGREDKYVQPTMRWLLKHIGKDLPWELDMRKTGDSRKDAIIKTEMFDEHIRGKYNVHVVIDDRQQVVDMWRSLGLNVFQVAEGDF